MATLAVVQNSFVRSLFKQSDSIGREVRSDEISS